MLPWLRFLLVMISIVLLLSIIVLVVVALVAVCVLNVVFFSAADAFAALVILAGCDYGAACCAYTLWLSRQ